MPRKVPILDFVRRRRRTHLRIRPILYGVDAEEIQDFFGYFRDLALYRNTPLVVVAKFGYANLAEERGKRYMREYKIRNGKFARGTGVWASRHMGRVRANRLHSNRLN